MLEALKAQPQDKILQLIQMFKDDPRTDKIDLGVGVYKDATGLTPVMRAVKAAEKKIWETQDTKTYTALTGEPGYNTAMRKLILAGSVDGARLSSIATPGGTGAVPFPGFRSSPWSGPVTIDRSIVALALRRCARHFASISRRSRLRSAAI